MQTFTLRRTIFFAKQPRFGAPALWCWVIVAVSVFAALASYLIIEKLLISFSHRRWWQGTRSGSQVF